MKENDLMKVCKSCGELKPHRWRSGTTHCSICRDCSNQRYTKSWSERKSKPYNQLRRLKLQNGQIVRIHEKSVEILRDQQNNKCAICGEPPGCKDFAVDHCHKTGAIRGLLCFRCNVGIGIFGDDISLLRQAIAYLEK